MIDKQNSKTLTEKTIRHYDASPQRFWEKTKDHDVTQNYQHFLDNIQTDSPFNILDFGCGPGRDLKYFSNLGHNAHGLDGCAAFCKMAEDYSQCKVFHQNFLEIDLEKNFYHGIFANASLFHIPKEEFLNVLSTFNEILVDHGILFSSNPRGQEECLNETRYAHLMELPEYKLYVEQAGFELIDHYYRPDGVPEDERRWLACVFRKK